ncbi:S1 family peptidase [Nocardia sp. CDC160]|uniref:S1 family peptidase n=1 Tax=Nocardia sp. CDC160 TaxID=3112166 RepID=UPI002DB96A55|nr:serine protease [Nocardia sp. CDC160]MEC3919163.1 serine protease [Nocardia sp. CDC160]
MIAHSWRTTVFATALFGFVVPTAVPAQAVVGGSPTSATQYPWLGAISTSIFPLRPGGQFCAGELIAPDQLLTAGHCGAVVQAILPTVTVTFGRTDLDGEAGTMVGVKSVRIHPGFHFTQFGADMANHDDVALLTLSYPLSLPTATIGAPHGDSATVVGWGATSENDDSNKILRSATVPLNPDSACTAAYGAEYNPAEALCAGSPVADTAEFDSGGPLLVDGQIVGLCSWAKGSAEPGYPGVYARPLLDF